MLSPKLASIAVALILCVSLTLPVLSQQPNQWTQWRGPNRDGSVPVLLEPEDWPVNLRLLWEREVGGGYSGPIVLGDRVWIHSRDAGKEIITCLRLADGQPIWRGYYEAPFTQDTDARQHGLGPYSTPSLADGRLFTLGVTSILSAWDAEEGKLLWRKDYSEEFDFHFGYFGTSSSPLVYEDLCFVHFGGHERSVAVRGVGDFIALKVQDGSEQWRWSGDCPAAGASAVVGLIEGHPQLILKTLENMVGLEPGSGEELWRFPYKVAMGNTISTPLLVGDLLVTSDYQAGFQAWQIESQQDGWTVRDAWKNPKPYLFCSSPVAVDGQVIGFSGTRSGELVGLGLSDGQMLWRGEPRWGEHATLVAWRDTLLVFREDGVLIVGKVSEGGFREIRRYPLGSSQMWGHPAVLKDQIIIKDGRRLAVYNK